MSNDTNFNDIFISPKIRNEFDMIVNQINLKVILIFNYKYLYY